MSKYSSAKYYQNNKERTEKKISYKYQIFSKEENEKEAIRLWTIQKSTRRWKTKSCGV